MRCWTRFRAVECSRRDLRTVFGRFRLVFCSSHEAAEFLADSARFGDSFSARRDVSGICSRRDFEGKPLAEVAFPLGNERVLRSQEAEGFRKEGKGTVGKGEQRNKGKKDAQKVVSPLFLIAFPCYFPYFSLRLGFSRAKS